MYGTPRATKDIDFLVSIDDDNLKKLEKALYQFGIPSIDMTHFKEVGNFFRMGHAPLQIDIITEASGINIKECYPRRNIISIGGIDISVISKDDLIKNKKASARHRDLADVENLLGEDG